MGFRRACLNEAGQPDLLYRWGGVSDIVGNPYKCAMLVIFATHREAYGDPHSLNMEWAAGLPSHSLSQQGILVSFGHPNPQISL